MSNNAFVDWRYSFEDPNRDLHYSAGVVIPCVKRVIGEACPFLSDSDTTNPSLLIGLQVSR
jgi:hypothetical protein